MTIEEIKLEGLSGALFAPGEITITPAAANALGAAQVEAKLLLLRHLTGDYGDVSESEMALNACAIAANSGRVCSEYRLAREQDIDVLTVPEICLLPFMLVTTDFERDGTLFCMLEDVERVLTEN